MSNKRRFATKLIATCLVITGFVGVSYASIQIFQMNHNTGGPYLPVLSGMTENLPQPLTSSNLGSSSTTSSNQSISLAYPKLGQIFGQLSIPVLHRTINIVEGTDAPELKKGVGHFIGSVLPGVKDNSVLAGHRDSVFSQLGKVKIGDLLIVTMKSTSFTYKVNKIRIVMANDRTVIVPTPTAVLTLSTCYPFFYFGSAPKRYIVSSTLISATVLGKKIPLSSI